MRALLARTLILLVVALATGQLEGADTIVTRNSARFHISDYAVVEGVGFRGIRVSYHVAGGVSEPNAPVELIRDEYQALQRAGLLDRAAIRVYAGSGVDDIRVRYPGLMALSDNTSGEADIRVTTDTPSPNWRQLLRLDVCRFALENRSDRELHSDLLSEAETLLSGADWRQTFTHENGRPAGDEAIGKLIDRMMPAVAATQQYDAGAYRFEKAVEVLEAERTATQRALLYERHLASAQRMGRQPLTQSAWRALWPRRKLFSQDFERAGDWTGRVVLDTGGGRWLTGITDNQYFGRFMRVGLNYDHGRAATETWIRFRYRINKVTPIQVMVFDLSQQDNHRFTIETPVKNQWAEVELNITADFERADGSHAPMRAGDAIDDLFFGAGPAGDSGTVLEIDDVELIGRD